MTVTSDRYTCASCGKLSNRQLQSSSLVHSDLKRYSSYSGSAVLGKGRHGQFVQGVRVLGTSGTLAIQHGCATIELHMGQKHSDSMPGDHLYQLNGL